MNELLTKRIERLRRKDEAAAQDGVMMKRVRESYLARIKELVVCL